MTTLLDVLFVRTTPTPGSFALTAFLWTLAVAVAAALVAPNVLRLLRNWLTEADLEQIDDDDLDYLQVDRGEVR